MFQWIGRRQAWKYHRVKLVRTTWSRETSDVAIDMGSFYRLLAVLFLLFLTAVCKGLDGEEDAASCWSRSKCRLDGPNRNSLHVVCSNLKLTEVPRCKLSNVRELDLEGNFITIITPEILENLTKLCVLDLSNNDISYLPEIKANISLKRLDLSSNKIKELPEKAFPYQLKLKKLHLQYNQIAEIPNISYALSKMPHLRSLDLSYNKIKKVPENAFPHQRELRKLFLSFNEIKDVPENAFSHQLRLRTLNLNSDNLERIHENFFGKNGSYLSYLDLSSPKLVSIPFASIRKFKRLKDLKLHGCKLQEIPNLAFKGLNQLEVLDLHNTNDIKIGSQAFAFLPKLTRLCLVHKGLKQFPNLTGTHSLKKIEMVSNEIEEIPDDFCNNQKFLEDLNFSHNKLKRLPNLSNCSSLILLKMDDNQIESFGKSLHGLKSLKDVTIKGNKIKVIGENDFKGLKGLENLFLDQNQISEIHENAFSHFKVLHKIEMKDNKFPRLPTRGLQSVMYLNVQGNLKLRQFPSPSHFPKLEKLDVQFPYHCCLYLQRRIAKDENKHLFHNVEVKWTWLTSENLTGSSNENENIQQEDQKFIKCTPEPGPFYPCENLMGDWVLRCGVWIVFLLALTGNATVIIVILASHTKMDVSRFLISNLAFADLFMGIYLGFLAVVDASTFGKFKNYALEWQFSAGCKTAGFLAVLSSELSVFTLTVITLERYIAIKNAIRVNRKLELKTAVIVMAIGWLFAIVVASLPLLHISSYSKFSVCLPFEIGSTPSIVFLAFLLCLNATAFLVILFCYILMYCSIRGSNAWNASDFRVAKRMALLVFTDFSCWAPIVFLSLTAAFGTTFVSPNQAKIFTVFVFPLNSCANPFLYAIFTSHFKKDLVALCRRVEDKYPFLKITRPKTSFSRRSSYSGAISENHNLYMRVRRFSLPIFQKGIHNSVTSHDKGGSSASTNSNNKVTERNALVHHCEAPQVRVVQQNVTVTTERETCL